MWLAEGRAEATWPHTAAILAAVWSANTRLRKPRLFRADEFDPFAPRRCRGTRITRDTIQTLKDALLPKKRTKPKKRKEPRQ
ncbi:MAG TPA: hypothetical protein VMW52_04580 [Phycisphaerae bacterium]|nr:hypothetical protein [Phycisphaerae bacterium]